MRSSFKILPALSFAAGVTLAAAAVAAEDPNLTGSMPAAPAAADSSSLRVLNLPPQPDVFGTGFGTTWVDATKFTLPLNSSAPGLSYSGSHYYRSAGSAAPARYFAPLDDIPNGALVLQVSCLFEDDSAGNNLTFQLQKYQTNFTPVPPVRSSDILVSGNSAGTPGVSFINMPLPVAETIVRLPTPFIAVNYHLAADVATDTSINGCYVFWARQISPAPAVATFTDVPTGAQFFREIEALVDSGITAGCTASQFCPDQAVTRRQMAAFLARALGLHFP
jgi:hypothetical protein